MALSVKRDEVIEILSVLQKDIRRNGIAHYHLLLSVCHFVNSLFCDCRLVEYWVFDMSFGQNQCMTEMGIELSGLDTIEGFVDYLFTKYGSN